MSRESRRIFRDVTICGAGLVYLALVLFVNLDSPLFGIVLIALAGYGLWDRRGQAKPPAAKSFRHVAEKSNMSHR
jgi:hypothetical protein